MVMDIDLRQAMGAILAGEDGATPEVAGVLPRDTEGAAITVTLLDQVAAVQVAGQPAENDGIGYPLINDFE
jgi:hypothetical protein